MWNEIIASAHRRALGHLRRQEALELQSCQIDLERVGCELRRTVAESMSLSAMCRSDLSSLAASSPKSEYN